MEQKVEERRTTPELDDGWYTELTYDTDELRHEPRSETIYGMAGHGVGCEQFISRSIHELGETGIFVLSVRY